jgi:hypothetical protein
MQTKLGQKTATPTESGQAMSDEEIEVRIVPVEVFGPGYDDRDHEDQWGYGLMDAVQAWSDCNRACGHIYRFDDLDPKYRLPGETLVVRVNKDDYEKFAGTFWNDGPSEATRASEIEILRAELSALRAAQPLTREGIDAVIQRVRLEGDLSMTVPIEVAEAIARFVFKLRDALLDSLADGEAK